MTVRRFRLAALITCLVFSTACVSAPRHVATVRFPVDLQGVWQAGVTSCRKPGELDSDQRIEITERKLLDYEQWQEPLEIKRVSTSPLAWTMRSRLHIDEHWDEVSDLLVISGESGDQLTVINRNQSVQYERCR